MDLRHYYLSIYPDSVWWTIHSSGMLKWRSWEYSFAWCTIMYDVKHLPSDWLKTSDVHYNDACSPVCTFRICSPGKSVSSDDLVPLSIGIKTNFVTVPHLRVSWLNPAKIRRDSHILYQRLIFSALSHGSSTLSFCVLTCILSDMIVGSIKAFLASFFLVTWWTKYIFWGINQDIPLLLWFYLSCIKPDSFIIPLLV